MKIDRIQVNGFGRLRDFDTGAAPLGGMVVVLGPNEAGKSTLFTFLTTALYGFQPAARERNPHVPWGADEASGSIRVRLEGGGCAEVERRLRSQPSGRLTIDGRAEDLRNQPLPWVEHVPRMVFRQVFALTLGELAGLDGETWARIQDKVVGSMGASDLHSARAVAETLERGAGEIWRPNRRGNQQLRSVQAELRALRARRSAAHDRDLEIRDLVEQQDHAVARLHDVRERRQLDRISVERVQSLVPAKRQLERIAALRDEGGLIAELRDLPSDPLARWQELEEECSVLEQRVHGIEAELAEQHGTLADFDDRARSLLEKSDDISRLCAAAAGGAGDRVRTVELRAGVADLEARLDAAAEHVLEVPWRDAPADALLLVSIDLLRDRIARRASAPERGRVAPGLGARLASGAALLLGGALLAWGLLRENVAAAGLGAGAAAVGLTLVLERLRRRPDEVSEERSPDAAVTDLLAGVPVAKAHLRAPGEALVSGLGRVQELLREREQRMRSLEAALARVDDVDARARELASELGLGDGPNAEVVGRQLDRDLRRAERQKDAAALAARESRRLGRELETAAERLRDGKDELSKLRKAGESLGGGDTFHGLAVARARLDAHRRADQLTEELERTHPVLDELAAQIAEAGADARSTSDEELAHARARLEAHEEEIERLVKRVEALERDAAHLRELETVDAVDGEIASLKEIEARLIRDRDRKWVLAQLLREADRRFREEHQPDLVRRAGSYLKHLTGGRYERLVVDETSGGNLFGLVGPGLPAPVTLAPPVSTGTLEQAYLSLRLAIVDHLDQGGERLPLFVDEVFVNWDRQRQVRGLEVLAGVSAARQVFVFTCHPAVAEELERRGGRTLRLGSAG